MSRKRRAKKSKKTSYKGIISLRCKNVCESWGCYLVKLRRLIPDDFLIHFREGRSMSHGPNTYRFFLMTVDPVHVGTGGMRLGRVDNPIVREPGTRVPKIPGTALHGAIRAYAAHRFGKPRCAGQGKTHCGRPTCPICYTFGYARDQEGGSSGVVAVGDARILLFPVYSMVGPVWVTCPGALHDAGFYPDDDPNKYFEVESPTQDQNQDQNNKEESKTAKAKWPDTLSKQDYLNLGWLMVKREKDTNNNPGWNPETLFQGKVPGPIRNRAVLVSDKLFSQIVNSNLEVRTSVAINPETGAAEEGALFTYEAIPRATILWMEMVESDFKGEFPNLNRLKKWEEILQSKENKEKAKEDLLVKWGLLKKNDNLEDKVKQAQEWLQDEQVDQNGEKIWRWEKQEMKNVPQSPFGIVQAGLEWVEHLGVGGMGTRGFGRIRTVDCLHIRDKEPPKKANSK